MTREEVTLLITIARLDGYNVTMPDFSEIKAEDIVVKMFIGLDETPVSTIEEALLWLEQNRDKFK